jgi:xylulokinase
VLSGESEPPLWAAAGTTTFEADPTPAVRARYAAVRDLTADKVR